MQGIQPCLPPPPPLPMQVIQADQHLACEVAHHRNGHALVVVALDQAEQIVTQHLKHHTHVLAMWSLVLEPVQQLHAVPCVLWVTILDL